MTSLIDVSCTASSCLNGGSCVFGMCACPMEFQGLNCEIRVTTASPCGMFGCVNSASFLSFGYLKYLSLFLVYFLF